MTPHSVLSGDVPGWALCDLEKARALLTTYADSLTCHGVCELLQRELSMWTKVQGRFNNFEHSWLETRELILDP